MSGRERIERAARREPVDHPPLLGGWITGLEHHLALSGLTEREFWADKVCGTRRTYRALGVDGLIANALPPREGHAEHRRRQHEERGKGFDSPEAVLAWVEALPRPDMEFDAQAYDQQVRSHMRECRRLLPEFVWMPASWHRDGRFMWQSQFGDVNYLTALGLWPERMVGLFEYAAERARLENEVLVRIYEEEGFCKVVLTGQDLCDQRGPVVRPDLFERVYFPLARRAFEPLIEADFQVIWHSDGNITPIVDGLIALGIAGFQGFQRECGVKIEDIARRRTVRGERLLFFSGMNVTRTLAAGNVDDVYREIDRCLEATDGGRGFFLCPNNTIGADARLENLRAAYAYAQGVRVT